MEKITYTEIFYSLQGKETDDPLAVGPSDVVLIPDGAFHRVINDGDGHMLFNCVFQGQRNH